MRLRHRPERTPHSAGLESPALAGMLAAMNLRESLTHAWVTIGVPGTIHPRATTYVRYPASGLPPLPAALSDGDGLG